MAKLSLTIDGNQVKELTVEGSGWKATYDSESNEFRFEPGKHAMPSTQIITIPLDHNGWIDVGGVCMYSTDQERFVKQKKQAEETSVSYTHLTLPTKA